MSREESRHRKRRCHSQRNVPVSWRPCHQSFASSLLGCQEQNLSWYFQAKDLVPHYEKPKRPLTTSQQRYLKKKNAGIKTPPPFPARSPSERKWQGGKYVIVKARPCLPAPFTGSTNSRTYLNSGDLPPVGNPTPHQGAALWGAGRAT